MTGDKMFLENPFIIQEISLVFRYVDPAEHYPMRNHGRRHHGILYVVEGRERYGMKDAELRTEPGDVLYMPKSEKYDVNIFDDSCTVLCVDFETSAAARIPAFKLRPSNPRLLITYFTEIERCWQMKRAGWALECMSLLYHIMAEMQRQLLMKYAPSEKISKMQPVVDYLHRHFDDPGIRVESLARKCDYHPRYFAKAFRELYGVSPKQYLTQLRMERARELILSNRLTVSQVAKMTGFTEIYHFSKVFKHEHGVSPTEYNKSWEGNTHEN